MLGRTRHRRPGLPAKFASVFLLGLVVPSAVQANDLLIDNLSIVRPYSPYSRALLEQTSSTGVVSGKLRPLLGDPTEPVTVSGRRGRDVMTLTFLFEGGPRTLVFRNAGLKHYGATRVRLWQARDRQGKPLAGDPWTPADISEEDDAQFIATTALVITEFLEGAPSAAAKTLTRSQCGPYSQELYLVWDGRVTEKDIAAAFGRHPDLAPARAWLYLPAEGRPEGYSDLVEMSLQEALTKSLALARSAKEADGEIQFLALSAGQESFLVERLRRLGLFRMINLSSPGCGGAELQHVVVPRHFVYSGSRLSPERFQGFVEGQLIRFANQPLNRQKWRWLLTDRTLTVHPLPTPVGYFRVKLVAASELTRRVPGFWDSFYVVIVPVDTEDNNADQTTLQLHVERSKTSRRSRGSSAPPDSSYFTSEIDFSGEADIALSLMMFIRAQVRGWCRSAVGSRWKQGCTGST